KDKNIELKYVLNIQPYVDNVRKGTVWTGCWEIDCIINKHRLEKHWDEMDTIFMANTFRRVNWTKKHIMLYQACDSSFYNELSDKKI
ncbi:hypothetical protein NL529_30650, partial [Klebsiella pneumoniae]|nr:hypothetical protein [Klebsiella pneumoniae]